MHPLLAACSIFLLAACDRFDRAPKTPFDGVQALAYIEAQLAFGPRVPGTPGHVRTGDWITAQMRERADTVIEQRWTHTTTDGVALPMRNILARYNPDAPQRVLYVAHWDTRPRADSDRNLGNQQLPIPGANDGGSGVALLIALGDQLKALPPTVGVDLLFVDGEDYGDFNDPELRDVLIGARHFAANLPSPGYRPMFGVVWDMIGDANLELLQEGYSLQAAPEVVARVWDTAAQLGYGKYFVKQPGTAITDDHLPLINAGLRVIDVIDICYAAPQRGCPPNAPAAGTNYHHTMQDTIDKVSAASLKIVGDVALKLIRDL
ncbi:MAG: M28 family peptidase [Gemmatimonadaceae bacterium]|nr:M28 family peptidase [Gemmatimonadaceae bacterium]